MGLLVAPSLAGLAVHLPLWSSRSSWRRLGSASPAHGGGFVVDSLGYAYIGLVVAIEGLATLSMLWTTGRNPAAAPR